MRRFLRVFLPFFVIALPYTATAGNANGKLTLSPDGMIATIACSSSGSPRFDKENGTAYCGDNSIGKIALEGAKVTESQSPNGATSVLYITFDKKVTMQ